MKLLKKITILNFLFIILSTTTYAASIATTMSEEGFVYYGQKIKIKLENGNLVNKIIEESVSGVPFGLHFDTKTGYLEGIVDIEEEKNYPYENLFSYDILHEDGTIENIFFSIFTAIPSVDRFELIKNLEGEQVTVDLGDNDTINYIVDGHDIAIRATGFFEIETSFFFADHLAENLIMDLYINNSFFKRENIAPYALNGDHNGKYNILSLKEGTYTIGTKLYSKSLNKYVSEMKEITVVIVDPVDVTPVVKGIKGDFPRFLGTALDITIDARDPNGLPLTYTSMDLPETLKLNSITGRITGVLDLNTFEPNSVSKPFTIKVANKSYSESIEIRIPELQAPVINAITLINADTDMPIKGYENVPVDSKGDVAVSLELTNEVKAINVVVNTNIGKIVGGVVDFTIDNTFFRRERVAPYALAGNYSGNFLEWKYPQQDVASLGFQRIKGTAIIKKSKSLVSVGTPVHLSFVLIPNFNDIDADEIIKKLTISPNPATDFIALNNLSPDRDLGLVYQIMSATTGTIVQEDFIRFSSSRIDISDLPKGMYSIMVATESGISRESFQAKFVRQ